MITPSLAKVLFFFTFLTHLDKVENVIHIHLIGRGILWLPSEGPGSVLTEGLREAVSLGPICNT